ncbi:MAG TPA: tetratricopeptide repeat protein [Anaerolineales bacterium]|jgi:tetratricopeptide (TPR) repeat protein
MENENPTPALDEKLRQLQAEVENARRQPGSPQLPASLKRLGQAYLDTGDAPAALTEFNEAIKLVGPDGDQESLAQLVGFKGLALKLIGNYSLAMQAFLRSNAIAKKLEHAQLACDSYMQIAMLQAEAGKNTEAIATLTKALDMALKRQDLGRKMRVCSLMADNFYSVQAFDKAVDYYVLAYETARDLGNRPAECNFLIRVANVFLMERELTAAIGQYERALKIASAIEDRVAEISILGGLFRAHALAGNEQLALVYGSQAVELAGQIKLYEAEIANIKVLASYLIENNHTVEAIPWLEKGLKTATELNNLLWQMDLAEKIGYAWFNLENYPLALGYYRDCLNLAERLQDKATEGLILGRLGLVQAESGDLPGSTRSAEKSLALAEELENKQLAAEQQIMLAFNHREAGDPQKAADYCRAAIETFEGLGDTVRATEAGSLLAELEG